MKIVKMAEAEELKFVKKLVKLNFQKGTLIPETESIPGCGVGLGDGCLAC